jgi:NADPH-dependent ferric siderophore reductase
MVSQHGIDKSRIRAASYWKRGAVAVHEAHDD